MVLLVGSKFQANTVFKNLELRWSFPKRLVVVLPSAPLGTHPCSCWITNWSICKPTGKSSAYVHPSYSIFFAETQCMTEFDSLWRLKQQTLKVSCNARFASVWLVHIEACATLCNHAVLRFSLTKAFLGSRSPAGAHSNKFLRPPDKQKVRRP